MGTPSRRVLGFALFGFYGTVSATALGLYAVVTCVALIGGCSPNDQAERDDGPAVREAGGLSEPDRPGTQHDLTAKRKGIYANYELYTEPDSRAAEQADLWRSSRPNDAEIMDDLATVPLSLWLGDWTDDVEDEVDDALDAAGDQLRSFVVYNIPDRDCGSWSSGGEDDAADYEAFIDKVAFGLAGRLAIVVLEPDGLALDHCLDDDAREGRLDMLSDAVDDLSQAGAAVYIDAGSSNWVPAEDMAERLLDAKVENAAGFALNVSHTEFTVDEVAYAKEIRAIIGNDAHYVIDTGRNGTGPAPGSPRPWCNPLGLANGRRPTLDVSRPGLDAQLWIKKPGHSDGYCNGGPEAGDWWPEYALDLAERAAELR